ncbi:ABC transporter related [Gloeomargarita lithophora Alchichica-D10]|uniref:ABC transporter related n=1 Tax=Gloeomargarita lithophora Alchichica-D10 TaxID=1188229 RepID=A0A1J0AEN4_9CYAN|nr:ABC transporter ATP-binding protein [Gloeomargarita lithophora]APB34393.1 ABC transporter related [Gloeomargarita lithophora Alchichica-D10]
MEPPALALHTENLTKTYRTGFWLRQKVTSLNQVSLTVYGGETFGLLGPNGAGKTTFMKLVLGIIRPTGGGGTVLGRPLGDRLIKARIGYLPENPYLYESLTGWECLELMSTLHQVPRSVQKQRLPELLDLVGLAQQAARKKTLRRYSKGMLQRIGLAQSLVNDPDLVLLDEPMSGLDPLGRYQVREIILQLKSQGKTIFFNSHILSDVEHLCDRVAVLARGELLAVGTLDELLGSGQTYQVQGRGGTADRLAEWIDNLAYQGGFWQGQLRINLPEFVQGLADTEAELLNLNLERQSLEEFFVQQLRQRGYTQSV